MAVAVSGGGDSLALVLLLNAAFPGRVQAVTVDHGLRVAARGEAALVARWMAAAGIPHAIISLELDAGAGNLQARARAARYAALGRWCRAHGLQVLITGHSCDDQAETVLMRLVRGSGLRGLAGMRDHRRLDALNPPVWLLRPALGVERALLRRYLVAAGQKWIEDPSNTDTRFDRVRMRTWLGSSGLSAGDLARSAASLAQVQDELEAQAAALFARACWAPWGGYRLPGPADLAAVSGPVLRLALEGWLRALAPDAPAPRGPTLDRGAAWLSAAVQPGIRPDDPAVSPASGGRTHRVRALTLAGARLIATRNGLVLVREAGRLVPGRSVTMAPQSGCSIEWDCRFRVELGANSGGMRVAPLGTGGWARIRRRVIRPDAPLESLAALPALWQADEVIHQPLLGYRVGQAPEFAATATDRPAFGLLWLSRDTECLS